MMAVNKNNNLIKCYYGINIVGVSIPLTKCSIKFDKQFKQKKKKKM